MDLSGTLSPNTEIPYVWYTSGCWSAGTCNVHSHRESTAHDTATSRIHRQPLTTNHADIVASLNTVYETMNKVHTEAYVHQQLTFHVPVPRGVTTVSCKGSKQTKAELYDCS